MGHAIHTMCGKCGGKCCQYFCFEIDTPDTFEEFENLRWFLLHEGITIHIDEGHWYISIANRCKSLADDGRCLTYEDRPLICRRYDMDNCDFASGDYEYEQLFETPEQIERHARKALGKKAWRKAENKAHAKLARKAAKRQEEAEKTQKAGKASKSCNSKA